MGTSRGYKMPTGGNWKPLKNEATAFVKGTGGPEITPASLVANFIRVKGGFKGLSRGIGGSAAPGISTPGSKASPEGRASGGTQPWRVPVESQRRRI
jgi:hypothetical protein